MFVTALAALVAPWFAIAITVIAADLRDPDPGLGGLGDAILVAVVGVAPAVVGLVLSVRGRPLAGASAARGLGTAGLVIGIVAVTFAD